MTSWRSLLLGYDATLSQVHPNRVDSLDACRYLFEQSFDIRLSCEDNLRAATALLIENPPSIETLVRLRSMHDEAATLDRYPTGFVWLSAFNALRIIHQGSVDIVGSNYLTTLRADNADVLAPTWEEWRSRQKKWGGVRGAT